MATPDYERVRGDVDDLADAQIEAFNNAALQAAKNKAAAMPPGWENFDGLHCVDCDIEIPDARRAALGLRAVRCVACQTLVEKRHG